MKDALERLSGVILIKINFTRGFLNKSVLRSFSVLTIWVCNYCRMEISAKAACKLLVKLTIVIFIKMMASEDPLALIFFFTSFYAEI